ncbi:hypothetical protein QYE76_035918 [Lolium multiflorum]|uniref:CCHC-type domain-containing protein n=1 Tax=Lolium multiflorum TaxID=4521 RepID=A0AAD8VPH2_LOLMU|nr:hypothetical protein QYE76_035918 [Lolium multiflorum]
MPAAAATKASPPTAASAVGLASAALASRRSDPAIRGQVTKRPLLPKAKMVAVEASPPAGPAPLVGAPSGQLPVALEQLSVATSSQPASATFAPPEEDAPPPPCPGVFGVNELAPEAAPVLGCCGIVGDGLQGNLSSFKGCEALVRSGQVGSGSVEVAPTSLPGTSAPAAHAAPWFGTSDAAAMEEVEGELASLMPQSADGREAGDGVLPLAAAWPASWVSAADNDDEDGEEELVPRTPPATKFFNVAAALVDKVVGKETECVVGERDGWQEVMPRRGPCRPALPVPPIARRPIPVWLKGRCCRCLALGHRAAVCCDPFRCSRCLENGHRARDCRNAWRPLSLLAGRAASSPRQADAPCRAQVEVSLPSDVPYRRSWASVVSAPVGSLASANMQSALEKQAELLHEVVRPLHEVVDSLHGWMLAIGGFLERAEAMLGRLSQTSADPLVLPNVGKVGASIAGLHGCFSPRAGASSVITAPVMHIMHELLELCGGVPMPHSIEKVMPDLHESSDVPSPPCQALGFEKCGGVGDEVSVIPVDDGVTKSGLLPTVPRAVVAREVCDFLATLAVAFPGSAVG